MRFSRLAFAPLALVATSAFAADLPARNAAPSYIAPAPVASWSGFYLGLNAGFGGGTLNGSNVAVTGPFVGQGAGQLRPSGFVLGGQLGYNMQFGSNVVAGLEGDVDFSGIRGGSNTVSNTTGPVVAKY